MLVPRTALGCAILLCLCCASGCSREGAAKGSSHSEGQRSSGGFELAPSSAEAAGEDPLGPARRPTVRFVLTHGGDECVMYWEDGDQRSAPEPVRCPRDVVAGEQIRLTGRVCFREGGGRARHLPIRCPAILVAFEIAVRQDAGVGATAAPAGSTTP